MTNADFQGNKYLLTISYTKQRHVDCVEEKVFHANNDCQRVTKMKTN